MRTRLHPTTPPRDLRLSAYLRLRRTCHLGRLIAWRMSHALYPEI